jgi:hypothetical protein
MHVPASCLMMLRTINWVIPIPNSKHASLLRKGRANCEKGRAKLLLSRMFRHAFRLGRSLALQKIFYFADIHGRYGYGLVIYMPTQMRAAPTFLNFSKDC